MKKNGDTRSSVLGVRLESSLVDLLEQEATNKKTTKSRIARDIIQNYFHVIKPRQKYEKITLGRNMFQLCFQALDSAQIKEFSNLGISNAIREMQVLKYHSSIFKKLETDSMKAFSEELFSEWKNMYGSEGLGWLTSIEVEYNEEKDFIYAIFSHNLNQKFSEFLLMHFPDLFKQTSPWNWQVIKSLCSDTKLELYFKLNSKPNQLEDRKKI